MRFASLGSGSRGNATLIQHAKTTVLVDCGFSARETEKRLQQAGVTADSLSAILITHEHADHINGVRVLARRYQVPVFSTAGTASALPSELAPLIHEFSSHEAFAIRDLQISPFPVPHDAREPSQFVFSEGADRLGLLTDAGFITPVMEAALDGCDALLLEANHDEKMLEAGDYPASLKERVGGRFGHLSNSQSAGLLSSINTAKLQHIVAMHISEKNNAPEKVTPLFAGALGCDEDWIGVASQMHGFAWREISQT